MPTPCINYNCAAILDQVLSNCGDALAGGIDKVVILACDTQLTDPSDATQITTEIAAGRAWLYSELQVGINEASPVTVERRVAGSTPRTITKDWTATWMDENVNSGNTDAYNSLDSSTGIRVGGLIASLVDEDVVLYVAPPKGCNFQSNMNVPNNNTDSIYYNCTVTWKDNALPQPYPKPAGIFD